MPRPIALFSRRATTATPQRLVVRAFADTLTPLALLPLRLFLGVTFAYAAVQKIADPQYLDPAAAGYAGVQLAAFADGSPIRWVFLHLVLPHAAIFGALVAGGELAIGLGTLTGLFARPAALGGLCLSTTFFLSASWQVSPYFYGSDIVFAFCWLTLLLTGRFAARARAAPAAGDRVRAMDGA
jgi:thiosulfate dehydrogenase [quinone] large subunit